VSSEWPEIESRFMFSLRHPEDFDGRPLFGVMNKRQRTLLAEVFWYAPWRQFCFRTASSKVVISHECAESLAAFCKALTERATG